MRQKIVAGNWKMNGSLEFANDFVSGVNRAVLPDAIDVVVCPPAPYLLTVSSQIKGAKVGAQNVYFEASGAYTGELSPKILQDVGCEYVLVGHSERRALLSEVDDQIAKKVKAAIDCDLKVILCVGETLEQRASGKLEEVISAQVLAGASLLDVVEFGSLVVAYEPVWAIGTGQTASPQQAQEVHALIRSLLVKLAGETAAENVSILYGGSVNASTAAEIFAQADIDGGLVGGASLKLEEFLVICDHCANAIVGGK